MNYYTQKIDLVAIGNENNTFLDKTPWGEYEFAEYTMYDAHKTYKKDTIFIVNDFSLEHDEKHIVTHLLNEGYKVIIDAVWEGHCRFGHKFKEQYPSQVHLMYTGSKNYYGDNDQIIPDFFWVHEYLYNKRKKLDYYKPEQQTNYKKYNFFMPMRKAKPHRDMIFESLSDRLPQALYSYCDKGITLPMDERDSNLLLSTDYNFDRNFNSDWYDDSYFSVVTETFASMSKAELVDIHVKEEQRNCYRSGSSTMLTEKTFKPIAFEHPFIIFGQVGTLKRLHRIGFETFPHLFNEDYDKEESIVTRLAMIKDCVNEFNTGHYMNPRTKEVLDHNRAHFYNADTIRQMIDLEIVCPLKDFINA